MGQVDFAPILYPRVICGDSQCHVMSAVRLVVLKHWNCASLFGDAECFYSCALIKGLGEKLHRSDTLTNSFSFRDS